MAVDLWKRLSRDNCSNIIISFLLRCVITTLFRLWGGREDTGTSALFFFLLEMETYSSENAKERLLGFLWLFFFQTEATPI